MTATTHDAMRFWTLAVPTVSAFVASLVRDFQKRDDILQETAIAVLESFNRYDSSQSFVGWAIGIARNQVRLHFRQQQQQRQRISFDSDAVDALARAFAELDPHDPQLEYLAECVDKLDVKARELCRMRYELDLKPASIGERLDVASNAVAKALQRIRDQLRECIERKVVEANR